jgi:uncharacterized damage-inducible protein DinB
MGNWRLRSRKCPTVTTRAEQLVERFTRMNAALVAVAQSCSDEQWRTRCGAEGWTVGVTVGHVAVDYLDLLNVIEAIAKGRPVPIGTQEELEERNAGHAQTFATHSNEETIALLQRNAETVARRVERLRDDQLARSGVVLGRETTIEQIVTVLLPSHIDSHLASIRTAM